MSDPPVSRTGHEAELQAEVERLRAALELAERRAEVTAVDQATTEVQHATDVALARTEIVNMVASSCLEVAAARTELAWAETLCMALWLANTELAASRAALRESEAHRPLGTHGAIIEDCCEA
jgi:hypothetical protein